MQNFEEKIIDYLYGNLKGKELKEFEAWLEDHKEVLDEVSSLKDLRQGLKKIQEVEVIPPSDLVQGAGLTHGGGKIRYLQSVAKWTAAIAASLVLLIMVGMAAGLQLKAGEGQVVISFGAATTEQEYMSREEVALMLASAKDQIRSEVEAEVQETSSLMADTFDARLAGLKNDLFRSRGQHPSVLTSNPNLIDAELEAFRLELQRENEAYLDKVLTDFYLYMETQRTEDFQYYQARLNNLEEITNNFQFEAGAVLANLTGSPSMVNIK